MAERITHEGKCPICNHNIARQDKDRKEGIFFAVKSMRASKIDGSVTGECPLCKNEIELPLIRVRKIKMSKINVNIFAKKDTNKS